MCYMLCVMYYILCVICYILCVIYYVLCVMCQKVKRLLQHLYLNKYKKKTLRREDQKRCSFSLSYAHLCTVNPAV